MTEQAVQKYARIAGILFFLSLLAGGFGEIYAPSRLVVPGDAAATVANINASTGLFHWGFIAYLVEALCDVALSLIFYALLKPVSRELSLLAAFFGLMGTALFAVAELFYLAPRVILAPSGGLGAFSPEQLQALALLSMRIYAFGGGIFMVFYGAAWVVRGALIVRSGYLPRFLGVLLTIGGFGFILRNLALVLAPRLPSEAFPSLMLPGGLLMIGWLLAKGVDGEKWREKAAGPSVGVAEGE